MSGILICHRNEDATQATRLASSLSQHATVRRSDDATSGVDTAEEDIKNCDVLIVIIGPHWLESAGGDGIRRIDDPNDPIRQYLELTGRYNCPLIVALFDGASLPPREKLPDPLWYLTVDNVHICRLDDPSTDDQHVLDKWLSEITAGRGWNFKPIGAAAGAPDLELEPYSMPDETPARHGGGVIAVLGAIGEKVGEVLEKIIHKPKHDTEPVSPPAPQSPTATDPSAANVAGPSETQFSLPSVGAPIFEITDPVLLGASAPQQVRPGSEFTARFVAYLEHEAAQITKVLQRLSPRATPHMGLKTCQWQHGTPVNVSMIALDLVVSPPTQRFIWNGEHVVLDFDVIVSPNMADSTVVLKFDVSVDDIVVARLRLDLQIASRVPSIQPYSPPAVTTFATAARTAFASYSSKDRQRVLDRIAAVRISAGLDIFLDCLSLRPSEKWKATLAGEIKTRDLFLLFWSTDAAQSQWVTWEWQTALREKGKGAMQIHPLQSGVRPPEELNDLHFGDAYMLVREGDRAARSERRDT